jgi:hypothetical protein
MSEPLCAACGHPRDNHPFRHRFVGPSKDDTIKELEAKLAECEARLGKAMKAADRMLDAFCVHETQQQVEAYDIMCATLAEIEGEKG